MKAAVVQKDGWSFNDLFLTVRYFLINYGYFLGLEPNYPCFMPRYCFEEIKMDTCLNAIFFYQKRGVVHFPPVSLKNCGREILPRREYLQY